MITMNQSKLIYIVLGLICSFSLQAQDIHFSQFYNMPVHQNPSLTGHIEGTYRVNIIYRNQWSSITSGGVYSTPGASFDMNFKLKPESKNSLGAGITFLNDQTGGGDFTNQLILASAAYHMNLDKGKKEEKTYLSFGIQGGYINKRLNTQDLIFAEQFDTGGNVTQPATEVFNNTNASGGDIRVGATFSAYPSDKMNYKMGLAYNHIIRLKEVFISDSLSSKLPGRISFFAQGDFLTKNPKLSIMPELLFMNQAKVNEINLTTNLGYQVTPDLGLIFGAGYRMSDAAIANLGFEFKGVKVMGSYDVNLSKLTPASRYQGGFEISVGYIGSIKKGVTPELPCIRFN